MKHGKRILLLIPILISLLFAGTIPEVTGANAAVAPAASGTARWVQVVGNKTNTSDIRVSYGVTATATNGIPVVPGGGMMLPPQGQEYSLAYVSVYIASGDKVSFVWN